MVRRKMRRIKKNNVFLIVSVHLLSEIFGAYTDILFLSFDFIKVTRNKPIWVSYCRGANSLLLAVIFSILQTLLNLSVF